MVPKKDLVPGEQPWMKIEGHKNNSNDVQNQTNLFQGKRENIQQLLIQQEQLLGEIESMVKEMPFFIKFDDQTRKLLLQNAELREYKKDEFIIRQGELGDGMYVILYGTCNVMIKIPHPVTKQPFDFVSLSWPYSLADRYDLTW